MDSAATNPRHEQSRLGDWMISSKGNKLYPLDLRPDDIDIEEIAHALSNICRFGGHCQEFYSVAQHSLIVSSLCPRELQLIGLLHDAPEAYIGDMVRPLKINIPEFRTIEDQIWTSIAAKFTLPFTIPDDVCIEDARVLLMEKRDILIHHEHEWRFPQCTFPNLTLPEWKIIPQQPKEVKEHFLFTFRRLYRERK